jgi:tetratricopeptide (TPR) repeat protein
MIPTNPPRLLLATSVIHNCLDRGDLAQAAAWLSICSEWISGANWVLGYAEHQLLWARYHHLAGDPNQARSFATEALARASDPRQPLVLIAAHRFHGELDTIDGRFDTAEEHLRESLTLAEACSAPFERALTLLEISRLRATQGRIDEARTLVGEVHAICGPLGAKPTLTHIAELKRTFESGGQEPRHV